MNRRKLEDMIFKMVTYINGVIATYEDKIWLTINLMIEKEFLHKVKIKNNKLYVETV